MQPWAFVLVFLALPLAVACGSDKDPAAPCLSPLRPSPASPTEGCSCDPPDAAQFLSYCIQGTLVACYADRGQWTIAADGPCRPFSSPGTEACQVQGGTAVPLATDCPSGFHYLAGSPFSSALDATIASDGGAALPTCCLPLWVTRRECTQAGFRLRPRIAGTDQLSARCDDDSALRGFVKDETTLCCE